MGLNCGASCAKYLLFAFNVIFFLGGAAVLGVGIWILVSASSFQSVVDQISPQSGEVMGGGILSSSHTTVQTVGGILVGVGGFVFLVGFLGCCGACKEWRPLLVSYAICLIIVMLVEVGVGIAVGVYKDKVKDYASTELGKIASIYDYVPTTLVPGSARFNVTKTTGGDPDSIRATAAFNALHTWIGCCGITNGHLDFAGSKYSQNPMGGSVPPVFCCKFQDPAVLMLQNRECYDPHGRADSRYSNFNLGCVSRIENFINANAPIIIGVTVGIGLIELIGVFFAFCLCCAIGDKNRYD